MVVTADSLRAQFHDLRKGVEYRQTFSTGYDTLDEIVKLSKGFLAVVTGYPSHGKSEWLDALLINCTLLHNWKTMYYSPENHPVQEHIAKLAEKIVGKWVRSFTKEETDAVLTYLNTQFAWIPVIKSKMPTIEIILEKALHRKNTLGLDCLVIDPWNGVKHMRNANLREDEYLAEVLTEISFFARENKILVFIVAHPKTAQKEKGGKRLKCTVDDISGGTMWWNKVDYAFIAHRDFERSSMEIEVAKIKQKWMGTLGSRILDYDRVSGRFKGTSEKLFTIPTEIKPPF